MARVEGVLLAAGRSTRAGSPKALARLGGRTLLEHAVATLLEGGCERVTVVVGPALSPSPRNDGERGGVRGLPHQPQRRAAGDGEGEVVSSRDALEASAAQPLTPSDASTSSARTESTETVQPERSRGPLLHQPPSPERGNDRLELVKNERVELGMLHSLQLAVAAARPRAVDALVMSLVDHPHVSPRTVAALIAAFARGGATVVRPLCGAKPGHPVLIGAAAFPAIAAAPATDSVREVLERSGPARDVPVDDDAIAEDLDTREDLARAGVTLPSRVSGA